MPDSFPHDIFLSHSAKDKAVVRPLAERLRADGVKVTHKDGGGRRKAESEPHPSSFILHPLLESGTFRFRDPVNKERRFLPPRLDDAPIKGSGWFRKDDDVRWQPSGARQIAKGNPQGERGGVHQFGVPPKGNANFAWVQDFIHECQSRTLATLRDTLLPKLLSGELAASMIQPAAETAK